MLVFFGKICLCHRSFSSSVGLVCRYWKHRGMLCCFISVQLLMYYLSNVYIQIRLLKCIFGIKSRLIYNFARMSCSELRFLQLTSMCVDSNFLRSSPLEFPSFCYRPRLGMYWIVCYCVWPRVCPFRYIPIAGNNSYVTHWVCPSAGFVLQHLLPETEIIIIIITMDLYSAFFVKKT